MLSGSEDSGTIFSTVPTSRHLGLGGSPQVCGEVSGQEELGHWAPAWGKWGLWRGWGALWGGGGQARSGVILHHSKLPGAAAETDARTLVKKSQQGEELSPMFHSPLYLFSRMWWPDPEYWGQRDEPGQSVYNNFLTHIEAGLHNKIYVKIVKTSEKFIIKIWPDQNSILCISTWFSNIEHYPLHSDTLVSSFKAIVQEKYERTVCVILFSSISQVVSCNQH